MPVISLAEKLKRIRKTRLRITRCKSTLLRPIVSQLPCSRKAVTKALHKFQINAKETLSRMMIWQVNETSTNRTLLSLMVKLNLVLVTMSTITLRAQRLMPISKNRRVSKDQIQIRSRWILARRRNRKSSLRRISKMQVTCPS